MIYQTSDGSTNLEVHLEEETVWLTQAQMVTLFERDQSVISRHINSVFREGELDAKSNMHFLHIANSDRPITLYNLDVTDCIGDTDNRLYTYQQMEMVGITVNVFACDAGMGLCVELLIQ